MTFRARLLIGFGAAAFLPLALLTLGVRHEVAKRLTRQYEQRVDAEARMVREDLARESAIIAAKLATLRDSLADDNDFRLAVRGAPENRSYLLDYAARAMRLTGLTLLQVQDEEGRIVSSGHFRNEFDRLEPDVPRVLASAGDSAVLLEARLPEGSFVALSRVDSVRVGGRGFHLVGGVTMDDAFLSRFRRGDSLIVVLQLRHSVPVPSNMVWRQLRLRFADGSAAGGLRLIPSSIIVGQSLAELEALQREMTQWFLVALAGVALGVAAIAAWLSARMSQPLAELAQATSRVELEGADFTVVTTRDDEIGTVARRLGALTTRLRISAGRLRDAERRATVGDMARQVNHDIKNGLIPIRNVLRHLGEVTERQPAELPAAFADRRGTLDASVEYLDTLAKNYARLTPRVDHGLIDVNAVAREAAVSASVAAEGAVETRLTEGLPRVHGDAVVLRRILDNLVRNALESVGNSEERLTVSELRVAIATARGGANVVIVTVADTGKGMTTDELAHAFDDFFTTKASGTGLGLSVVRRLTADLQGTVRVESVPGRGTTFTLELPV
jgi:signal transduction histidine kinase